MSFNRTDISELMVGASVLAFPVAITEEVWDLSESISLLNVSMTALVSCAFLSVFIHYLHGKTDGGRKPKHQVLRVFATYAVTLLVCASILLMLGKLPLLADTQVAINRIILVAFPASFSATVVDSLR
jgi:uncharacterized membrane protein